MKGQEMACIIEDVFERDDKIIRTARHMHTRRGEEPTLGSIFGIAAFTSEMNIHT